MRRGKVVHPCARGFLECNRHAQRVARVKIEEFNLHATKTKFAGNACREGAIRFFPEMEDGATTSRDFLRRCQTSAALSLDRFSLSLLVLRGVYCSKQRPVFPSPSGKKVIITGAALVQFV